MRCHCEIRSDQQLRQERNQHLVCTSCGFVFPTTFFQQHTTPTGAFHVTRGDENSSRDSFPQSAMSPNAFSPAVSPAPRVKPITNYHKRTRRSGYGEGPMPKSDVEKHELLMMALSTKIDELIVRTSYPATIAHLAKDMIEKTAELIPTKLRTNSQKEAFAAAALFHALKSLRWCGRLETEVAAGCQVPLVSLMVSTKTMYELNVVPQQCRRQLDARDMLSRIADGIPQFVQHPLEKRLIVARAGKLLDESLLDSSVHPATLAAVALCLVVACDFSSLFINASSTPAEQKQEDLALRKAIAESAGISLATLAENLKN